MWIHIAHAKNFGQGISNISYLIYGQIFGQSLSSILYLFVARGDTETEGYAWALWEIDGGFFFFSFSFIVFFACLAKHDAANFVSKIPPYRLFYLIFFF